MKRNKNLNPNHADSVEWPEERLGHEPEQELCHEHGGLVLDLATGRLDDPTSAVAETVRRSCPACRSWWEERLLGRHAAAVDSAVAEAFSSFEVPHLTTEGRPNPRRWLAAAAIFLALVIGWSLMPRHDVRQPPMDVGTTAKEIFTRGFEPETAESDVFDYVVEASERQEPASGMIFVEDFEESEDGPWSSEG